MYFVIAAIGEMRVNREDIVGEHSDEVKEKLTACFRHDILNI